jgi:hypothetical protein
MLSQGDVYIESFLPSPSPMYNFAIWVATHM